ncbi:MAG: nucleotide exchange factor GrpE [Candidatus Harrisonbacteria bacterium CG10_big_fil_rev_8_21_14_0_10_40_38]|uniref:Protein GrpE n=1 Tax=Candidatus Harrisonbacteria bacterium CG10_big_fil_rev_8_21_14_0_10_40_38 TaxID=1974583 RepID=A0A2H0USB6_9BACT|nr:MAG: nucleotide exchange factor GrpE [Candidatus Harrisonbacteria bacterium CG10_big_fil_rev_8_21_14_0_10_40_38]
MNEKDEVKNQNEISDHSKCESEKNEYLEGWKRAKADLINYKRDEEKRFEEVAKFSVSSLLKEIIPVLDSFDLAITALEKNGMAEKGILMIRAQLEDALRKGGLEKIAAKEGDEFDPQIHESIGEEESEFEEGKISNIIEKGYSLHGRVVRPARVKVSK